MEEWVTIRNIKKRQPSLGTRKIAKMLGISRNTVKRALSQDEFKGYQRPSKVTEELSKFSEFIGHSYLIKQQKISVIISNLRSKGFSGSDISVYRYIGNNLKGSRDISTYRTFERYETLPGEQMLYDWSEYNVLIGEEILRIYIHCTLLGFSRYRCYDFSLDKIQGTILDILSEAFFNFGGVCGRIQVDNAVQFVSNPQVRNLQWNENFLSFCGYYGTTPSRSLPGHPWSKGKVENPFYYLENHFIKNNTFVSLEAFKDKLNRFQEEVNNRRHATTKFTPAELFLSERESLLPLPSSAFVGTFTEFRKVTSDCLISYKGNRYSVPHIFALKDVWIKRSRGTSLMIYSENNKLIAEHSIVSGKGNIIIDKSHYKSKRFDQNSSYDRLSDSFRKRFPFYNNGERFLQELKNQKKINPRYHLCRILEIFDYYDDEACISVLEEGLKYKRYHSNFIKGLISANAGKACRFNTLAKVDLSDFPTGKDCKRELKEYRL